MQHNEILTSYCFYESVTSQGSWIAEILSLNSYKSNLENSKLFSASESMAPSLDEREVVATASV